MNGIKLTIAQKEQLHDVYFAENTFFNCVQDINNEWYLFLSEDDIVNIGEYAYLLDIPLTVYEQKTNNLLL